MHGVNELSPVDYIFPQTYAKANNKSETVYYSYSYVCM